MREPRRSPRRRVAFTLIELLVVMALILVITALGIGYVVFGQDNQHAVTAAQAVTGALLNAKRPRPPRRPCRPACASCSTRTTNVLRRPNLQFIQQPEDYNAGQCNGGTQRRPQLHMFSNVDFQGGANFIGEIDESTVQAGDYFTVSGLPTPHMISKFCSPRTAMATHGPDVEPGFVRDAVGRPAVFHHPRAAAPAERRRHPAACLHCHRRQTQAVSCQNVPLRTLTDFPPPGNTAADTNGRRNPLRPLRRRHGPGHRGGQNLSSGCATPQPAGHRRGAAHPVGADSHRLYRRLSRRRDRGADALCVRQRPAGLGPVNRRA